MTNGARSPRMIPAADVLSGRWNSANHPYRYVVIWHGKELMARYRNRMMDTVLSAVETLEEQGWELVSVDEAVSIAVLRRSQPSRPGQPANSPQAPSS